MTTFIYFLDIVLIIAAVLVVYLTRNNTKRDTTISDSLQKFIDKKVHNVK